MESLPYGFDEEKYIQDLGRRKTYLKIIGGALIAAVIAAVILGCPALLALIAAGALFALAACFVKGGKNSEVRNAPKLFTEHIADGYFDNMELQLKQGRYPKVCGMAVSVDMHFRRMPDNAFCTSHFVGEYRGVSVEWCDLSLTYRANSDDSENVMDGQYIICDFRRRFPAQVILSDKSRVSSAKRQSTGECPEFDEMYAYTASDGAAARRFLSPAVAGAILSAGMYSKIMGGRPAHISFSPNGRVIIAADNFKRIFLTNERPRPDALMNIVNNYFSYVCGIIDRLLLGLKQ